MRPLGVCLCLAVLVHGYALFAQETVSDVGHIGLYADSAATSSCAAIPVGGYGTFYVLATLAGVTSEGISGAEFRVEVRKPAGWSLAFQPVATSIVIGDPIDMHPGDASDASGVTLVFPTCRPPDPVSGKVLLGKIVAANLGGEPTDLWLRRRTDPSNKLYPCALLLDCRVPYFNKWCMAAHIRPSCTRVGSATVPSEDCDRDPALFVAAINKEVEPPPPPDRAPSHPEREVIAMLTRRTLITFPPGRTYAPLDHSTILEPGIETVLRQHDVQVVSKAFPCFDLADTVATTRDGRIVRLTDWSLFFVFLLPVRGDANRLAEDLEEAPGVVFAEANGFGAVPASDSKVSLSAPNPLRRGVRMVLDLTVTASITLDLYDVTGRRVRRLQAGTLPPGAHPLAWDGKDDGGRPLARGVYVLRFASPRGTSTRKVVVLD